SYHRAIAGNIHSEVGIAVETVVLDQVTAANTARRKTVAAKEAADIAVSDGQVDAISRVDADRLRGHASRQPADLEVVAIENDVVGVDGDCGSASDRGGQILLEA